MIKTLEDLTGVDAKTIRFDDESLIIIYSTSALGVNSKQLDGCKLGL